MKCPFCAEEIKDEAVRCKHCQADVARGVCLTCGKRNRLEAKFCRFCGSHNLFDTKFVREKAKAEIQAERNAWVQAQLDREAAKAKAYAEREAAKVKAQAEREAAEVLIHEAGKLARIKEMVLIPAGDFMMGSPEGEGEPNEHPRHKICLDAYYIGKYPVTVAKYKLFCSDTGFKMPRQPEWSTDCHPVVNVDWNGAGAYCKWAGKRLPTEAEWEKAARGGADIKCGFGDNAVEGGGVGEYAWYDNNSNKQAHPAGQKKPNTYGLYDMHGNIWEWVSDWYAADYYKKSPAKNPKGPDSGTTRGLRGGAWNNYQYLLRAAFRGRLSPGGVYNYIGFRCVASAQ